MHPQRKLRINKFIRNTLISFAVLAALFVGVGVAYTWYMGQQVDPSSIAAPDQDEHTAKPVIKPFMPSDDAPNSASVQSLMSPVAPGENSSITVKTNPYSECKISVEYNKIASKDSGLVDRVADEYGMVSWSWTVDSTAPVGRWPVRADCVWKNGKSAMVIGYLVVAIPTD